MILLRSIINVCLIHRRARTHQLEQEPSWIQQASARTPNYIYAFTSLPKRFHLVIPLQYDSHSDVGRDVVDGQHTFEPLVKRQLLIGYIYCSTRQVELHTRYAHQRNTSIVFWLLVFLALPTYTD